MQTSLDARQSRTVQRQSVGSGEKDFKEDEEVEQVARQERAIQPHQQELKERMEMRACAMPPRQREHDSGRGDGVRQQQHESR